MKFNIKYIALTILVSTVMTSCGDKKNEKQEKQETKQSKLSLADLETIQLVLDNPEYQLTLPGNLEAYESVDIYAKVEGFIKDLYVDRGSFVRKNQVLAVLEAPEMQQNFSSHKSFQEKMLAEYNIAQKEYERIAEAATTEGAVSLLESERAKSKMLSAKAAYESAKSTMNQTSETNKYLIVRAPFDGIITTKFVSKGALVGPRNPEPLFKLAQNNKLRLTVSLPEKHVSSIQDNTNATFTLSSFPNKVFDATLKRNSGLIESLDRSLKLEFDIDNKNSELKGQEYAQVNLTLKRNSATYWVPTTSIINSQAGKFVLAIRNNEVTRVDIKEGIRKDNLIEIFGDLSEQDKIIKKPSEEMLGMK